MKTAADVYSPVPGEITESNSKLGSDPALVNNKSESEGWLFKIKVSDQKELGNKTRHNFEHKYYCFNLSNLLWR